MSSTKETENTSPAVDPAPSKKTETMTWLKTRFDQFKEESSKFIQVGKTKWDKTTYQRERDTCFKALGQETYQLVKAGEFDADKIQKWIERIDEATENIRSRGSEIETLTKTATYHGPQDAE